MIMDKWKHLRAHLKIVSKSLSISAFIPSEATLNCLKPCHSLSMKCSWDNSATNQQIIDGAAVNPTDVLWEELGWGANCSRIEMTSNREYTGLLAPKPNVRKSMNRTFVLGIRYRDFFCDV